jgi:hypothetical protein
MSLAGGMAGAARIKVTASGGNLPVLGLPPAPPLLVQLQASTGECWEARFSAPTANDGKVFKGRSD